MRILLVTHRFAGEQAGGTEILADDLARALTARGLDVTWLAAGDPPSPPRRTAAEYISVPAVFAHDYPVGWRAQEVQQAARIELLLNGRPAVDLVHVLHFSRIGLAFLDSAPLRDVPVVATLTDYTAVCPDHQLLVRSTGAQCTSTAPSTSCVGCLGAPTVAAGDVESWRARNVAWLNGRVRALWTQTPHQAAELAKAGVTVDKVVRDRACYGLPDSWQSPAGSGGGGEYLLFLGRCSPEKGLQVLLDALAHSPTTLPLLVATVPDDAAYEERMRLVAAADPRVRWLPPLSRADVGPVLAGARALLAPSQWWENHPIVAHEARALGVPVWSSAVPSMRHLADDDGGVHLVEQYTDPASWRQAIDAAAACQEPRVPSFGRRASAFEAFVDEMVGVYRKEVTG
ncbi:glycosyltransferase [Streptomyces sp. SP17BM10]|uniref:glycosyltransferase n=1 Tax=Streptomyces sp. SP17BM10 TaxID=3002530 RepID=UPI002E78E2D7|nr:glycosyltransferase [Streptomyces sp. SP17BM10]MEE1781691.1 glycosyltransferase [Streptomyces sp. SP17BM10]